MATINGVLARLAQLRPYAIPESEVARWLEGLEGRLAAEVFHREAESYPPGRWDEELAVGPPYDGLYLLYAQAMVEYWSMEDEAYQNAAGLFEQALDQFKKEYQRTHLPERREIKL